MSQKVCSNQAICIKMERFESIILGVLILFLATIVIYILYYIYSTKQELREKCKYEIFYTFEVNFQKSYLLLNYSFLLQLKTRSKS